MGALLHVGPDIGGRPLRLPLLELIDLVLLGVDDLLGESCDLGSEPSKSSVLAMSMAPWWWAAIISTKARSNSVPVDCMRRRISASLIMPGISVSPWPP